jgi:hypothetical protein
MEEPLPDMNLTPTAATTYICLMFAHVGKRNHRAGEDFLAPGH